MNAWLLLKWLHVISSTVLLGTGLGIAYFMWRAHRGGDTRVIAATAASVVRADLLFTAVAVVVQPVTGVMLIWHVGYPWSLAWIRVSLALFVLVGCCWLPVVWLQWRMRVLAAAASRDGSALPPAYFTYFRWWFFLGWPAFAGVLVIFWLMIAKPA